MLRRASRSRFGVRQPGYPPRGLIQSLRSSTAMNNTFGRSFADPIPEQNKTARQAIEGMNLRMGFLVIREVLSSMEWSIRDPFRVQRAMDWIGGTASSPKRVHNSRGADHDESNLNTSGSVCCDDAAVSEFEPFRHEGVDASGAITPRSTDLDQSIACTRSGKRSIDCHRRGTADCE